VAACGRDPSIPRGAASRGPLHPPRPRGAAYRALAAGLWALRRAAPRTLPSGPCTLHPHPAPAFAPHIPAIAPCLRAPAPCIPALAPCLRSPHLAGAPTPGRRAP